MSWQPLLVSVLTVLAAGGLRAAEPNGSENVRPNDRGFDEYYGLLSGCSNFFNPAKQDPVFYNGGHFRPFAHNDRRVTEFPPGFYATDAFTDHAIETIGRFVESKRPFFVHLCYTAPHFPLQAPRLNRREQRQRRAVISPDSFVLSVSSCSMAAILGCGYALHKLWVATSTRAWRFSRGVAGGTMSPAART